MAISIDSTLKEILDCPEDKESKREEIKLLIKRLSAEYPDLKDKVFGAMQRLPLDGWGKGAP